MGARAGSELQGSLASVPRPCPYTISIALREEQEAEVILANCISIGNFLSRGLIAVLTWFELSGDDMYFLSWALCCK